MNTQNVQRKTVSRACGYWGYRNTECFLGRRVLGKAVHDLVNEAVSRHDDQCIEIEFHVLCDFGGMASSRRNYGEGVNTTCATRKTMDWTNE